MGTRKGWKQMVTSQQQQQKQHFKVLASLKTLEEIAVTLLDRALSAAARRDFKEHDKIMVEYGNLYRELRARSVAVATYDLGAYIMDLRRRDAFELIGRMLA